MLEFLSGETRLFPIIGDPISYAESPQSLTRSLAAAGHNGACVPMQVPDGELDVVMAALARIPNVDGVLVTMPHKRSAFRYCATTSERTKLLGVVSVMRRNSDGTWHGDMLDGLAFVKAQKDAGARPEGARVLLVGAGGAGSAIAIAMLQEGVRELIIHDQDDTRSSELVELLAGLGDGRVSVGGPDPTDCDMVCNATPMGMSADDPLPIDTDALAPSMFVGDVIAGHGMTPLVKAARDLGCPTAGGSQMVAAVQDLMVAFMLGSG
ncbi:shikimate dehydrogenase [Mycolicibacterium madagascariense]|nr:shikimate dehydrogenase [Mycolicibacterium madagascariense]